MDGADFKSMALYRGVDRIYDDLRNLGYGDDDAVSLADLTRFDQWHYEGVEAVDDAGLALGAGPESRILDVGAGVGGPARYLADRFDCAVTALEIQSDLHTIGSDLTARSGLTSQVSHVKADMLDGAMDGTRHTGLLSMLCVLHIDDRPRLFDRCRAALSGGAGMFIDDYVALGPLDSDERARLADHVFCRVVPEVEEYVEHVQDARFADVETIDMTSRWAEFVHERRMAFEDARSELLGVHDDRRINDLSLFYETVDGLFQGGRLGGLRLTAIAIS